MRRFFCLSKFILNIIISYLIELAKILNVSRRTVETRIKKLTPRELDKIRISERNGKSNKYEYNENALQLLNGAQNTAQPIAHKAESEKKPEQTKRSFLEEEYKTEIAELKKEIKELKEQHKAELKEIKDQHKLEIKETKGFYQNITDSLMEGTNNALNAMQKSNEGLQENYQGLQALFNQEQQIHMHSAKAFELKQKELEHPDKKKKRWWSLRK